MQKVGLLSFEVSDLKSSISELIQGQRTLMAAVKKRDGDLEVLHSESQSGGDSSSDRSPSAYERQSAGTSVKFSARAAELCPSES